MKISEAIEWIDNRMCWGRGQWTEHHEPIMDEPWQAGCMAIKALQNSQWIPCSERMPEEKEWIGTKKFGTTISDEVLVTFESQGERFVKPMSFQNGELGGMDKHTMNAVHGKWKVVAWMPLPEPWKGKSDE